MLDTKKSNKPEIGKKMYELYQNKQIQTEEEFIKKLNEIRGDMNG